MQKRHRIFIAINLPQDIKKELAGYHKKWLELPAKWTALDNLHITLNVSTLFVNSSSAALYLIEHYYVSLGDLCYGILLLFNKKRELIRHLMRNPKSFCKKGKAKDKRLNPFMITLSGF